ncbi:MAG: hypothetical protein AB7V32_04260 [Candidatus Berkiella sp.]
MLTTLNQNQLFCVSAGCGEDSCQQATLNFLHTCTMEQMKEINLIFKAILLSDEMINADSDTKKAALIAAIQSADI